MSEEASPDPFQHAGRTDRRQAALTRAFEELLHGGMGLHELTIEAITQEAGMSRSAFYFYFESKHDLLRAAARAVLQDMMLAANTFLDGTLGDPEEELRIGIQNVAEAWRNHAAVMRGLSEGSASDPALRQFLEEFVESFVRPVTLRVLELRATASTDSPELVASITRALLWMNERNFYYGTVQGMNDEQWDVLVSALSTTWRRALLQST